MRIGHLSDIHNGYRTGTLKHESNVNLREHDGDMSLSAMITDIIDQKVDAIFIAGDLFHSPFPTPRNIVFVQSQLRRLAKAGIKVYTLAGNHDTTDIKGDIAASKVIDDPDKGIYSHAEPYVKYEISDGIYLHMVSHHMYSLQAETMSQIKPVDGAINILTTHGSIIDPILEMRLTAKESPREIVIPDFIVNQDGWSYTMLGHIHERGWVGSMDQKSDTKDLRIYYNGSLIRRGFSDGETPIGRGWTLWEIGSDGKFTYEFRNISQRPQYDFPVIDAKDLTPQEITDIIVANLESTQTDGNKFDPETAPILRQVIDNITPSKKAALDNKKIDQSSGHAFDFKRTTNNIISDKQIAEQKMANDDRTSMQGLDILSGYDVWKEKSVQLGMVNDNIREDVAKKAREFVKLGQDEVLDRD